MPRRRNRRHPQYPSNNSPSPMASNALMNALDAITQCLHLNSSPERSDSTDRSLDENDDFTDFPLPVPHSQNPAINRLTPETAHQLSGAELESRQSIEQCFFNEEIRIHALFCATTNKIFEATQTFREITLFLYSTRLALLEQQESQNRNAMVAEYITETGVLVEDFKIERDFVIDDSAIPSGNDFVNLSYSSFFQSVAGGGAEAGAANITPQQPGLLARLLNLF